MGAYAATAGTRTTLAWVVMGGVNPGDDEIVALNALLADAPVQLNLIDVNDGRPDGYRRATPEALTSFLDRVQLLGVPIVRRYSVGCDQNSACGMLAGARCTPRS